MSPADVSGDPDADEEKLVKSMEVCEEIQKADPAELPEGYRERVDKARPELERAYLAKMSRSGSAAWEEAARAAGHAS